MKKKKKQIDKETAFMYKCRRCGEIFSDIYCGAQENRGSMELTNAIYGIRVSNQTSIPMISTHRCNNMSGGIADLIGYVVQ